MPLPGELWPAVASTLVGGGVFALGAALVAGAGHDSQAQAWRYDLSRASELRRVSLLYRIAEPLVGPLALLNRRWFASSLPEITRELQAAGKPRFWTAEEWLAVVEVQALLLSLPLWALLMREMGPPGLVLGLVGTGVIALLLRRSLTQAARTRLWRIKLSLPYLLDLLTLLMEAGATFLHALEEGVREFREEPSARSLDASSRKCRWEKVAPRHSMPCATGSTMMRSVH